MISDKDATSDKNIQKEERKGTKHRESKKARREELLGVVSRVISSSTSSSAMDRILRKGNDELSHSAEGGGREAFEVPKGSRRRYFYMQRRPL